jgi:hypothetical protein
MGANIKNILIVYFYSLFIILVAASYSIYYGISAFILIIFAINLSFFLPNYIIKILKIKDHK